MRSSASHPRSLEHLSVCLMRVMCTLMQCGTSSVWFAQMHVLDAACDATRARVAGHQAPTCGLLLLMQGTLCRVCVEPECTSYMATVPIVWVSACSRLSVDFRLGRDACARLKPDLVAPGDTFAPSTSDTAACLCTGPPGGQTCAPIAIALQPSAFVPLVPLQHTHTHTHIHTHTHNTRHPTHLPFL